MLPVLPSIVTTRSITPFRPGLDWTGLNWSQAEGQGQGQMLHLDWGQAMPSRWDKSLESEMNSLIFIYMIKYYKLSMAFLFRSSYMLMYPIIFSHVLSYIIFTLMSLCVCVRLCLFVFVQWYKNDLFYQGKYTCVCVWWEGRRWRTTSAGRTCVLNWEFYAYFLVK